MNEIELFKNLVSNGKVQPEEINVFVDLDGTLIESSAGDYYNAKPYPYAVDYINKLYDLGYHITIYTARGAISHPGKQYEVHYDKTLKYLRDHGIKFHHLKMEKPHYQIWIDDKCYTIREGHPEDWGPALDERIAKLSHVDPRYGELHQ